MRRFLGNKKSETLLRLEFSEIVREVPGESIGDLTSTRQLFDVIMGIFYEKELYPRS